MLSCSVIFNWIFSLPKLIDLCDYANGGYYSIKISAGGYNGVSNGTSDIPDSFEPDDAPDQAGVLLLNDVQDHSLSTGDQDWFRFVAP
jgi:hypothetical protein